MHVQCTFLYIAILWVGSLLSNTILMYTRSHQLCGIRIISIPAALKSVEDAVILVQRAESTAQVVVYWVHFHWS